MKRASILVAAALLMAACSPQVYPLYLDVRQPSSSGLDLSRKNLSIVYMDSNSPADSTFDRSAASSMARNLEADYFGGKEVIGLYHIPKDSVTLDLMHSLVMDTGGDVVFLLSSDLGEPALETNRPVSGATSADSAFVCPAAVPISTVLKVYDSMGKDEIHNFHGSAVLRPTVFNNGLSSEEGLKALALKSLSDKADMVGKRISTRFLSGWKTEGFSFYYYDGIGSDAWLDPLQKAADGSFAEAIKGWTPLTQTGTPIKKACAAYNIAMAFYLLENDSMATRWLEYADSQENLSLSAGLHKRLDSRLEKK